MSAAGEKSGQALVLSAGGLFGAYQAGVWAALAPVWQPDIVIGASVGTLNGWAIAGGVQPDRLAERWRSLGEALTLRFRLPRSPLDGLVDSEPIRDQIRAIYDDFQPNLDYGLTLTALPLPRPLLVTGHSVTAGHLIAACAVPVVYAQHRLEGRLFTDGGILEPVPLWAAGRMGATAVVSVSALPSWPWWVRSLARAAGPEVVSELSAPALPTLTIAPSVALGTRWDSIAWKPENMNRWVDQGYEDGLASRSLVQEHVQRVRSY